MWAVVVAGGAGTRFGAAKQYVELAGRRVLDWSVAAARAASDGVVVVVPADDAGTAVDGADAVVAGGATRAASVRCGLAAVPADAAVIVVHDAARPAASPALFRSVVAAVRAGAEAVVPGVPVADTLRRLAGGTVDRDAVVAVQTPQGFRAEVLRGAHAGGGEATDDAGLVEAAGGTVEVVPGEPANRKLTHPEDRAALEAALAPGSAVTTRVGMGFDVHPLGDDPERPMVLGGVSFPGPGLVGHSDADVIAHACADALLGAAGLGDIGSHFPDTDPGLAGADSIELLRAVGDELRTTGWRVGNVDCSVVCDTPKIGPHREQMQARLSDAAGGPVTVKGKRPEGLGALGRQEGIACWAVAFVEREDDR